MILKVIIDILIYNDNKYSIFLKYKINYKERGK